ncbi:hypothetical protein P152DRAFT_474896 [Eremomyces bilateralis CBS 781.70]|uniref:MICOS complex subunit n=1 Tax=Eremomyces bilateralis CBS 781.70 TaxID=1392243 RepID=A0A6G1G043_9PEZI|nr:uncharacterized protein P152DRAFT_474896 [Eremomyces bilateralis CBS 781.70]KAF1811296.1 hypothetical protein P152DRAFT_474896 [Eremomyces bilateralis CBS 781.70]
MAASFVLRPKFLVRAAVLSAGAFAATGQTAHAEEASGSPSQLTGLPRKPIYDDDLPTESAAPSLIHAEPFSPSTKRGPTPTDRLASYVKEVRLQLYNGASATEDYTNKTLTSALNMENTIATTIASLAPPQGSQERLVPGLLTVLLSVMGSSILARNRNIFLRASFPVAVGVGTMSYILPATSRNVEGLVLKWEEKVPGLKEGHEATKERVERFISTGRAHAGMGVAMLEEKIGDGRKAVEEWVSKGR